ncbi:MAG: CRISPR-associated endonuclease Cas1 [Candidatus Anstonellales archaeon]
MFLQGGLFDETNELLLTNDIFDNLEGNTPWKITDNVFLVVSENKAEVVVSGYDVKLSKKSERLVIKEGENVFYEIPFFRISHISIQSKGVSISSDLIEEATKRGIVISFVSYNGKPYALVSSPNLNAVIKTRRKQIESYSNCKGVIFSKEIVRGKISNQISTIKYATKNLDNKDFIKSKIEEIEKELGFLDEIQGNNVDEVRLKLLSIEARCGKIYWDCFREIIKGFGDFKSREHRGSVSPINSLLNYGYGMLYSIVWGAVLNAWLEPFAGFLHVDEPGRPSMVLDMVEEFRAPIVDRVVISFVKSGKNIEIENGLLNLSTRKEFSQKVIERLESYEYFEGSKYKVKSIIQIQSRRAASFFRDEIEYKSYSFKW